MDVFGLDRGLVASVSNGEKKYRRRATVVIPDVLDTVGPSRPAHLFRVEEDKKLQFGGSVAATVSSLGLDSPRERVA